VAYLIKRLIEISDGQITITDDGCGMDIGTIKNIWLKPGVSSKKKNKKLFFSHYDRLYM
jgi:chemotaxis protein histidine kinase CheA